METQDKPKVCIHTSGALRLENRIVDTQHGLMKQTVLVDYDKTIVISEEPAQNRSLVELQA